MQPAPSAFPLLDKLRWTPGGMVVGLPPDADAGLRAALPRALEPGGRQLAASPSAPWTLVFVRDQAALARLAPPHLEAYRPGGVLWFAYPKLSGALWSDLTRDRGWEPVGQAGFLGVTQVALDQDWSALRFRLRAEIPNLTRRQAAGV
jgi:hypothetical protein